MTRIVDGLRLRHVERAVAELAGGAVVAFPTETVYGLGAEALNGAALQRVYELKGRPADNPVIAHVADAGHAAALCSGWDDRCSALAGRFWPGPLTLVLPRAAHVPQRLTAGRATIAVRSPAHPVARRLIAGLRRAVAGGRRDLGGGAIGAPSANRSGGVSPTTARHVADDFAGTDLLILDGGPCEVGIESTVLDMSGPMPRVLRPGSVGVDALGEVVGAVEASRVASQAASPGTSESHYAPRTPTACVESGQLADRLTETAPRAVLTFDAARVPPPHQAIAMPRDAEGYAARLYHALRDADARQLAAIVIERPPETSGLWAAIHDRLRRASHG